ncbi:uncharacterized protein ARMOST_03988 [Armillaria ostoyae]|uniref:WW domain-containing protein n=1 Tax=Armillaria ostoyae TaxID=47428 RepID=A0A284QW25_ARMOS|nr:uncharacterized protein ARMOST_03988 [Armillaria ostoyae]
MAIMSGIRGQITSTAGTTITAPVPMPTSAAPRPSPIPIPTAQRLPSTLAGTPVNLYPGAHSAPSYTFRPSAPIPKTQKLFRVSNADRKSSSSYVSKVYATFPLKHATVEHLIQPENSTLESTYDWLKDEINAFLSLHLMMINFAAFTDEWTPAKFTVPAMQTDFNTCRRISPETGEEEVLPMGWTKHTYPDGKPYFYHKIITEEWLYDRDIGS